jgi:hypothetical protein
MDNDIKQAKVKQEKAPVHVEQANPHYVPIVIGTVKEEAKKEVDNSKFKLFN